MRWVKDRTGRLALRPYYRPEELDSKFEELICSFLISQYGEVRFPLKTDDLERILESKTSDLDSFADLSTEGVDIEGMTSFYVDRLPSVKISNKFTAGRLINRRRSTLAHELGHVILHAGLWDARQANFLSGEEPERVIRCMRQDIENPQKSDWLEWQAYYSSGAIVMPRGEVRRVVADVQDLIKHYGPIRYRSSAGAGLLTRCMSGFQVSGDAARVRLLQLGYMTMDEAVGMPIF